MYITDNGNKTIMILVYFIFYAWFMTLSDYFCQMCYRNKVDCTALLLEVTSSQKEWSILDLQNRHFFQILYVTI